MGRAGRRDVYKINLSNRVRDTCTWHRPPEQVCGAPCGPDLCLLLNQNPPYLAGFLLVSMARFVEPAHAIGDYSPQLGHYYLLNLIIVNVFILMVSSPTARVSRCYVYSLGVLKTVLSFFSGAEIITKAPPTNIQKAPSPT
jgi:hypothetical protein